jgi:asparagine synthase (glutamine-hydrolysing)
VCGIAGVLGTSLDVNSLLDLIAHRGRDGRGVYFDNDIQFGHLRLAIQDVSDSAAQPMTVDGTTVIYNGEAWNTKELQAEFPDREWKSTSDTEPITALLAREGVQALNKIDGMFAIAWNNNEGTWIARDRYGKIPLYVGNTQDGLAFASEIKAFPKGMKVVAVKPGTAIHLQSRRVTNWVVEVKPKDCAPEIVLDLLRDGVKQRLISDRPVCFLLSGGLDSSLVLALGRELYENPVAYTAVLDPASPDLIAARRIATHFDVPLIEVKVPDPTSASIREAVLAVENPMKAQVEIALAHIPLMKAIASDGYRVALSGEAADELFCGYGNMQIAASRAKSDSDYQDILKASVTKMSRGNFMRVNKVMMSAGVEGRLPFMEERLVATALASTKETNPPGKKVLKRAAEGVLPKWVISRPKQTFQGGTGITAAVAKISPSPIRYYNAEATSVFGWLPKE